MIYILIRYVFNDTVNEDELNHKMSEKADKLLRN